MPTFNFAILTSKSIRANIPISILASYQDIEERKSFYSNRSTWEIASKYQDHLLNPYLIQGE